MAFSGAARAEGVKIHTPTHCPLSPVWPTLEMYSAAHTHSHTPARHTHTFCSDMLSHDISKACHLFSAVTALRKMILIHRYHVTPGVFRVDEVKVRTRGAERKGWICGVHLAHTCSCFTFHSQVFHCLCYVSSEAGSQFCFLSHSSFMWSLPQVFFSTNCLVWRVVHWGDGSTVPKTLFLKLLLFKNNMCIRCNGVCIHTELFSTGH